MIENFIDSRGTLLRRDVVAAGLDDHVIAKAKRDGIIVAIHHGGYCRTEVWHEAHRRDKHRLRSHVVDRLYSDAHARSHVSALLELGGPDWGLDLTKIHLTSLYGIGERTQSNIVHHRGTTYVGDVTRRDGSWLTDRSRCALETALLAPRDPAVAVLDWAQSHGHVTRDELEQRADRMSDWPGSIGLPYKIRLSNGKAESVLETRGHLLCRDHGIPMFIPQYELFHPSGRLAARLDGAWPHLKRWVEFDGTMKYVKFLRPGETIEQVVLREKSREDTIRRMTGWMCIRVTWSEVEMPAKTAQALRIFLSEDAYAA